MSRKLLLAATWLVMSTDLANASEVCGNDIDDDNNGMVDEGCAPTLTTGVCESPLSCGTTGMISWSTGALHYDLPPDMSPKVPWGPGLGLRRFFTSAYSPGTGPTSVNHLPLGARWQHTYMAWIDRYSVASVDRVVLHTSEGRDVFATYAGTTGGWDSYTPQAGFHVMSIKRNTVAPNQYQVQMLTGEMLYFNSSGQITQIWDNLTTPNKVMITWTSTSNGNVSTVTDASGKRRLLFNYTSNLLTSVNFQLLISSVWTTQQTTTYSYTSGTLMSASIGPSLSQQYAYTSGYLTGITDATGKAIANFAFNATAAGQVNRVNTPSGTVGLELASTRTGCTGKTALYFNLGGSSSCSTDADCPLDPASGSHLMCGGKTGSGSTGSCFSAARCLGLTTVNGESVVSTVAPIGIGGGACTGACTEVAQYVWATGTTLLNPSGTADPLGHYTSATYNSNGLPTQIAYSDNDSDPTNGGYARTTYLFYDTVYPGRIAETRRQSDVQTGTCSATVTTACAREMYTYATDQTLLTMVKSGFTKALAAPIAYTYTTTYSHDANGRLTEIDGPATNMKTTYDYFSSTDPTLNGFLQHAKFYSDATNHLDTTFLTYDFWGNATGRLDPDGTASCRTFDSARNYLTQTREAMAGQTSCASPNAADITTSWSRDTALRLATLTRPDGACVVYSYTTGGRLDVEQRKDDCVSSGDYRSYAYTLDGQVSEVDTYTAAGVLKAKKPYTYAQSRRLQSIVNPVDSTSKTYQYDTRGILSEIDDEASLGKTVLSIDGDYRLTLEQRYKTGSTADSWSFGYDWNNEQQSYVDGDSHTVQTTRDDLGRVFLRNSPNQTSATVLTYDAADRLVTKVEGGLTHSFTYDALGRPLTNDYDGHCSAATPQPEIQRTYDAMPSGVTCPITGGCTNISGRLAYVKNSLMCSAVYESGDGSLDQETFYAYDAAGRIVEEYIRDDSGRISDHKYSWTKDGALTQFTTPSGAVLSWTYGSTGNNSDIDLVTSISQNGTTLLSSINWNSWGPLASYQEQATISSLSLKTVVTRNLAYRVSNIQMNNGSTEFDGVNITEDSKGRVNGRDYFDNTGGVQDSYFVYDLEDRVLCELTSNSSTCPVAGSPTVVKNNFTASPPFTNAGNWKTLVRNVRGAANTDTFTQTAATDRISSISQGSYGAINYGYNSNGDRSSDSSSGTDLTHSGRTYTYDARRNVINVRGQFVWRVTCNIAHVCSYQWHTYDVSSTFDAQNRRVSKTVLDETAATTQQWFYYYDAIGRLTEFKYTPNIATSTTYSLYQIAWLDQRPTMYTQTDFPASAVTRRYTVVDETTRIVAMWTWPSSGDSIRVWRLNPNGWGYDQPALVGAALVQPLVFSGQYLDWDTYVVNDTNVVHEVALNLNGARTFDPVTGGYLQLDPLVARTRASYVYGNSDPVNRSDPSGLEVIVINDHGDCTDQWYADAHSECTGPVCGTSMDCFNFGPFRWTSLPPSLPTGGGGGGGDTSGKRPGQFWKTITDAIGNAAIGAGTQGGNLDPKDPKDGHNPGMPGGPGQKAYCDEQLALCNAAVEEGAGAPGGKEACLDMYIQCMRW